MVAFAADKIDQHGNVIDQKTKEKLKELLESLVAWTRKLKTDP
jgi:chromate reductase